MIKVTGLKKHFGDLEVLKGIDQHIKQGEKVVVIGPSGSGKSTFLRCLNLLEVPTEGEILIEGESITAPKTKFVKKWVWCFSSLICSRTLQCLTI